MDSNIDLLIIQSGKQNTFQKIQRLLVEEALAEFKVRSVEGSQQSLITLENFHFDIILLDFESIESSERIKHFLKIQESANGTPIIVLTDQANKGWALEAVHLGAQDVLISDRLGQEKPLSLSILYALERSRSREQLRKESILDALTGLNNRRGFMALAEQQIKLAERNKTRLLFAFMDVDRLKAVNDDYGHPEGDKCLKKVSEALIKSYRESDIVARVGGDEFAALAVNASNEHVEIIDHRLRSCLKELSEGMRYPISLSVGFAEYNPDRPLSLESILLKADQNLYRDKKGKEESSKDSAFPHL